MIRIRVPATTANMGPGFDCMGVALGMYLHADLEEQDGGYTITGCPACYANAENLCVLAYNAAMRKMGLPPRGLKLHIDSEIPIASGLGSSASLLVAGVFGANALHGNRLSYEEMMNVLITLEEHPDNIAPALYGGMTAGFIADGVPYIENYSISGRFRFTVLVPDYQISTRMARELLPKEIPFKDAVFNLSRAAVLCKALEKGNVRVAAKAWNDRLHQSFRKGLIPDYDSAEQAAYEEGCIAFCISGSGSTMLAVSESQSASSATFGARMRALHPDWIVRTLPVDLTGACVVE